MTCWNTHTKQVHTQLCDYLETQVAVWDMAPGSVDDCCFCCSIDGTWCMCARNSCNLTAAWSWDPLGWVTLEGLYSDGWTDCKPPPFVDHWSSTQTCIVPDQRGFRHWRLKCTPYTYKCCCSNHSMIPETMWLHAGLSTSTREWKTDPAPKQHTSTYIATKTDSRKKEMAWNIYPTT